MQKFFLVAAMLFLLPLSVSSVQFKPLRYKFEKGQHISVEVMIESSQMRFGKIPIVADSIDERGGTHLTILPTEYGNYLGGAKFNAILTPRGQLRVEPAVDSLNRAIMQSLKADSFYYQIWGNDAIMTVYQFLFPYLPRSGNIAAALDTIQDASYVQRKLMSDEGNEDQPIQLMSTHHVRTKHHRGKTFKQKGVKYYRLYRTEEETEENCLTRNVYKFWRSVAETEWVVRERDGAMLQEKMLVYKKTHDGEWQAITRTFDASGGMFK